MALNINTNVASLIAQQNLSTNNAQLKTSVARLSSGYRVNSSADDAAGLARADQLKSQSKIIQASLRNANDATSALEVSDKAAEQITNLLTRMGELASSAAQGTLDATNRQSYSDEYDKLIQEIDRISNTTEFGGFKLLNGTTNSLTMYIGFKNTVNDNLTVTLATLLSGGTLSLNNTIQSLTSFTNLSATIGASPSGIISLQVGAGTTFTVSFNNAGANSTWGSFITAINTAAAGALTAYAQYNTSTANYSLALHSNTSGSGGQINVLGDSTSNNMTTATNITVLVAAVGTQGLGLSSGVLATQAGAQNALSTVQSALQIVNNARAVYGASTNRLSAAVSNLQVTFTNFQAAESRIRDADFAMETATYTRNQIMVQAGTSVLAQANTLPQAALTLLR